ncbi:ribonuclease H2 non-catalytic subunit-domain-containing protein [Phakopsora pachyrhizi]|uniref:Ribonuclease H2 non-catalytic subunit-domain-containing protein n=1 Tax=Phakopsora pachyrhizi TaxID=170000 RepID=A0AAV0ADP2_PHAPC|nr:ribonuclease H2 non-catalytic subunit-domain-containing protein [Phakopsora pachyrhizi]
MTDGFNPSIILKVKTEGKGVSKEVKRDSDEKVLIDIGKNVVEELDDQSSSKRIVQLDLMPFSIDHDGPSKISKYFLKKNLKTICDTNDSDFKTLDESKLHKSSEKSFERLESSFRGRYLVGVRLGLPIGYTGLMLSGETRDDDVKVDECSVTRSEETIKEGQKNLQEVNSFTESGRDLKKPKLIRTVGRFEDLTIWNPDGQVDLSQDFYFRSLDEWSQVSQLLHSSSTEL